jgi:hypothetical protein
MNEGIIIPIRRKSSCSRVSRISTFASSRHRVYVVYYGKKERYTITEYNEGIFYYCLRFEDNKPTHVRLIYRSSIFIDFIINNYLEVIV